MIKFVIFGTIAILVIGWILYKGKKIIETGRVVFLLTEEREKTFQLFEPHARFPGGDIIRTFSKKEIAETLQKERVIKKSIWGRIKLEFLLKIVCPEALPDPGIYFKKQKDGYYSVEGVYQDM